MLRDLYLCRGPAAAFAAIGVYWGAFAALVPVLKPQAGLSDGAFGLAMLVSTCGAIAAMWTAPRIENWLGPRALPVLCVAMAVAFLLPGLSVNGVMLALTMMGAAMASGTLDVAMNARVSVLETARGRSLMNLAHGLYSVAYGISALVTGLLREAGWSAFAVFALMGVVVLALAAQAAAAPVPDPERDAGAPPPAPLSWYLLTPLGLIVLIGFLAEQGTEGWSALHLERTLGAGAAQGALGPAILGVTMAVGRFSGQAIAHRFSEAAVISVASVLCAAGAVIAAWAPGITVAYAGFAMLGLGVSVVAPMAFAWAGRLVPVERKALAISRIAVLGYAGFFIGPPIMGGLSQLFGLQASFTVVGLLMLVVPFVLVPFLVRFRTA
jgi:MFS family permease